MSRSPESMSRSGHRGLGPSAHASWGRHNIVGSEVGLPRPPVYMRKGHHRRRGGRRWPWIVTILLVLLVAFLTVGALTSSGI